MRLSLRFFAAALFLSLASLTSAADLTIVRVLPEWRDAASFKRISEYFTGRENSGDVTILRTTPTERSGFYFLIRVENAATFATPAKLRLELITASDTRVKTYVFDASLTPGKNLLNLGLTGDAWTDPKANPVAWKLEILGADGAPLATKSSYLWAHPVAPASAAN